MVTKNKKIRAVAVAAFVSVEIALGVLLQTLGGRAGGALRMSAVVLCCLFCGLFFERSADYMLTQTALICTVCADYFLVWSQPRVQLPAMIFFLVVQMVYFARLYLSDDSARRKRWQIVSRGMLSVASLMVTAAVLKQRTDALALISMLYYANLILNVVFALSDFRKQRLLSIGLLLFLCCDTVVGLGMLDGYITIPQDALVYRFIHPGFDLAWACYLPSQVLITLSLLDQGKPTK